MFGNNLLHHVCVYETSINDTDERTSWNSTWISFGVISQQPRVFPPKEEYPLEMANMYAED